MIFPLLSALRKISDLTKREQTLSFELQPQRLNVKQAHSLHTSKINTIFSFVDQDEVIFLAEEAVVYCEIACVK